MPWRSPRRDIVPLTLLVLWATVVIGGDRGVKNLNTLWT
jgi:hypothetical protein